jgi:cyclic beta-1,2-glucan synthetase
VALVDLREDRRRGISSHQKMGSFLTTDNLRRTLSAPAAVLTLVAGWVLPQSPPLVWTAFVLATGALPSLLPALNEIIPKRSGISKRTHFRRAGRSFTIAGSQIVLGITFLAHQAWLMGDAIGRISFACTGAPPPAPVDRPPGQVDLSRDITGVYRRMRGRSSSPRPRALSSSCCDRAAPR